MATTSGLEMPALFDFDEFHTITNSFADKVFGHIVMDMGIDQMKMCTTFRNISPLGARIVRRAIDSRTAERAATTA